MPLAVQFCVATIVEDSHGHSYVFCRGQKDQANEDGAESDDDDEDFGASGMHPSRSSVSVLQCYDVEKNHWNVINFGNSVSHKDGLPVTKKGDATFDTLGAGFVSINKRLVVVGGVSGENLQTTSACHCWKPNLENIWKRGTITEGENSLTHFLAVTSLHSSTRSIKDDNDKCDEEESNPSKTDDSSTSVNDKQIGKLIMPDGIGSVASLANSLSHSRTQSFSSFGSFSGMKSGDNELIIQPKLPVQHTSAVLCEVFNQQGIDNFDSPVIYTGDVLRDTGRPHGLGRMTWTLTGESYEGEFVNGSRTGVGQMYYADGDYFEGRFINDRREGVGTYVYHRDGRIYRGLYVSDKQHDTKGVMKWNDGTMYSGAFVQGKRTGKGMITFPKSNVRYEGQFLEGKYHGRGLCTFGDDSFYDGDWNDGKAHGNGILVNCFGEIVHEGKWFNDVPVVSSFTHPTAFPTGEIIH
jgi:hypothetical protein